MDAGLQRDTPILIYDGDCRFCCRWVERLRRVTGDAVEYLPAEEAGGRFPEVPEEEFDSSVVWVEPDGTWVTRADAVFRALATGSWVGRAAHWAHARVPGFGAVADFAYSVVARNRAIFSRLTP